MLRLPRRSCRLPFGTSSSTVASPTIRQLWLTCMLFCLEEEQFSPDDTQTEHFDFSLKARHVDKSGRRRSVIWKSSTEEEVSEHDCSLSVDPLSGGQNSRITAQVEYNSRKQMGRASSWSYGPHPRHHHHLRRHRLRRIRRRCIRIVRLHHHRLRRHRRRRLRLRRRRLRRYHLRRIRRRRQNHQSVTPPLSSLPPSPVTAAAFVAAAAITSHLRRYRHRRHAPAAIRSVHAPFPDL
mmetsp:Transcript_26157/g.52471  ORF Transcript_26157/g.52471 Transcript_26157/m.52471 type:complete len:237 (+) Transcript_26157:259-969(+)